MNGTPLIAILDAAYAADAAGVGCLLARSFTAAAPLSEISRHFAGVPNAYVAGEFYRREMPLLQQVIEGLAPRPETIVIDGYVWLGANARPGLGARLFAALGSAIPVVGVAKTRLRDDDWSTPVCRGGSRRPLYVTAAGLDAATAARLVSDMHGNHRIPQLLQRVDRLARAALAAGAASANL